MEPPIPARQTYGFSKLLGLAGLVMFMMDIMWGSEVLILGLCAMAANIAVFPANILEIESPPISQRIAGIAMAVLFIGILFDIMKWPVSDIILAAGAAGTLIVILAGAAMGRKGEEDTNWTAVMVRENFAWLIIGGYLLFT